MITGRSTGRLLYDNPLDATPWKPEDRDGSLNAAAVEVIAASARLDNAMTAPARAATSSLLRLVNSYYSNLIEGHVTLPRDIERAMRRSYDNDPTKRNLQCEARVHVDVERRLRHRIAANPDLVVTSPDMLTWIHHSFMSALPPELLFTKKADGTPIPIIPGEMRQYEVVVGAHEPPAHTSLPNFLTAFSNAYDPARIHNRADQVIAAAAAHHRLLWIHPFLDGNGRVARLFTQAYFIRCGIDAQGLWSISRGLARSNTEYKAALAQADARRAGDTDGRGQMSDRGLTAFCTYFLATALDQITFITNLLHFDGLLERLDRLARDLEKERTIAARSGSVLREALFRGPLPRGEALRLFDAPERTARQNLASLLELGFLIAEGFSHKVPVSLAFPTAYGNRLFPKLYPETDTAEHDQAEVEGTTSAIDILRKLTPDALEEAIIPIIGKRIGAIDSTDEIAGLISSTNATGYAVDDWRIVDVDLSSDDEARITVHFTMPSESDPDSDRPFCGSHIAGTAIFAIDRDKQVALVDARGRVTDWPDLDQDDAEVPSEGDVHLRANLDDGRF